MGEWFKTLRLMRLSVNLVGVSHPHLCSRFAEKEKAFVESIDSNGVLQPIYVFEDRDGNCWLADSQNRLEATRS